MKNLLKIALVTIPLLTGTLEGSSQNNQDSTYSSKTQIDPTVFNTEEKWYKEGGNYLFTKKISKDSEYYISGKSLNQSFAKKIGMANFRYFLNKEIKEKDLKRADKNKDKILNAQELFNLKKYLHSQK